MHTEISTYERLKTIVANSQRKEIVESFSSGIPMIYYIVFREDGKYVSDFEGFKEWLELQAEVRKLIKRFSKGSYSLYKHSVDECSENFEKFLDKEEFYKSFVDRLTSRLNDDPAYGTVMLRMDVMMSSEIINVYPKKVNKIALDIDIFSWATIGDIFDVAVPVLLK